jgi:hypothetical protein
VNDYSHRDRRAQREADRVTFAVVGVTAGLTIVALAFPPPWIGVACVVALAVVGFVCMSWSDRTLDSYSNDLSAAREGRLSDGFARAETASPAGAERRPDAPPSRSPHSRKRAPTSGGAGSDRPPR